jgi:purine-binding chemotaxis protein CheW
MTTVPSDSLVVFQLGEQRFALDVTVVERVVRAVEIAQLPDAPRGVRGVINLQGRIVPVFDLWSRLGQPARAVRAGDHLIVARTHSRTVALLVDSVVGVVRRSEAQITPAAEILPDIESISGVMKLDDSLVLVHDLERFLSIEDHEKLQLALNLEP